MLSLWILYRIICRLLLTPSRKCISKYKKSTLYTFPRCCRPCKGAETDSMQISTHGRFTQTPKPGPTYGAQADSGRAQDTQVVVWLYPDMLTHGSRQLL